MSSTDIDHDASYWRKMYEERMVLEEDGFGALLADRDRHRDENARLVSMLRECQSALTGPASLRQRIEDLIGPRHERPFPEGE